MCVHVFLCVTLLISIMMGANLVMHNIQKIYVFFVPFESFALVSAFCTTKGESFMSLFFFSWVDYFRNSIK
jgi:hypothetical protein